MDQTKMEWQMFLVQDTDNKMCEYDEALYDCKGLDGQTRCVHVMCSLPGKERWRLW
jgi:hypothetical protein